MTTNLKKLSRHILPLVIMSLTAASSSFAIEGKDGRTEKDKRDKAEETFKGIENKGGAKKDLSNRDAGKRIDKLAGGLDVSLSEVEAQFKSYVKNPVKGGQNPNGLAQMLKGTEVTPEMVQESMKTESASKKLPENFLKAYSAELARGKSHEEAYIVALMEAKGYSSIDESLKAIKDACKV